MSEYDVGAAEGADLRGVDAGGCRIVLARVDGVLHAVGARCPHAGADLSEGVLAGGRIICPWHKAAFDVRSGACTAPPAVDDLPHFDLRVQHGRVLVRLPGRMPAMPPRAADGRCMAIIGAGAAGAVAAQTLRAAGFGGRIVLIGREDRLPYDRTLLSKYALSGLEGAEKTPLQSGYFYTREGIERRVGEVTSLDEAARRIVFADGDVLEYDAALLATGGTPRRPTLENGSLPGLFVLRDAEDCAAIVNAAGAARHCVVLGGGFIGMEAAASLRERGLEVCVVAPEAAPFARQLGARVGDALAGLHRGKGIAFRLGRTARGLVGESRIEGVRLDDGSVVPADLVVAGLGVTPATGMLAARLRDGDGGVPTDAGLRVAAHLYAAGDVAAFPLQGTGAAVRVEHWRVAQQHGRIAALNMLGGTARFAAAPVFWTIHFGKRLDYVGHAPEWDEVVIEGNIEAPEFLAYYLVGGHVRAVAGIGRDAAMATAVDLFDGGRDWTLAALRPRLERA